jgi:hypothetical protein
MRRKQLIVVPSALLLAGVFALIGCIPMPGGFKQPDGKPRPEASIGKLNSDKPIRIGDSTYAQVTQTLGPPAMYSPGGAAAVYSYEVNDVNNLVELCFIGQRGYSWRYLLLRFSADGKLESYKTYKDLARLQRDVTDVPLEPSPSRQNRRSTSR